MEKGKCPGNCGKYHPRICNAMKQNGFCFRGQNCYYAHFGDKRNRDTNENANNQRNQHYEQRQNPHTDRRKSMHNQQWQKNNREAYYPYDNHTARQKAMHNQQWQQNRETYHNDNHMGYNRRSENDKDFYANQQKSRYMMERAAEMMAEKMMWGNFNY